MVSREDKIHKIIFALKNYIYSSDANEMLLSNIKENINMILLLYSNHIKHGVEVELELDNIPDIMCYVDELNQVWSNLINNALQAMNFQGNLYIKGENAENTVSISIRDNGCGIPDEIIDMIFEPMFTTKPKGEGSGIGLDLVKQIITKHNGTISVESTVGIGSCFTVTLPIGDISSITGDSNG